MDSGAPQRTCFDANVSSRCPHLEETFASPRRSENASGHLCRRAIVQQVAAKGSVLGVSDTVAAVTDWVKSKKTPTFCSEIIVPEDQRKGLGE